MYQVLARKYRPKNFSELVGQTHVSKALMGALEKQRLHHAYLFTGTRGVGKTTIARILSKCLNCETGITNNPCGQCGTCQAIDAGQFIDLIEIDAASRTKVEDTRELLDQVPYSPTQGRYKVYLIDEVHMLSTHSFNALLKTLEEPPAHVKFLLATTDPQKLPITVMSRCLQFVLRPLPRQDIRDHLETVLQAEQVQFENEALWKLAESAQGSIRDALSLTDQAIAYGQGNVLANDVDAMLGLMDATQVNLLLANIHQQNKPAVAEQIHTMRAQMADAKAVLDQLIELLYQLALLKDLPEINIGISEQALNARIALAQTMDATDLQLYYQIAIKGRDDLKLASNPQQGLEMTILRLLSFKPLTNGDINQINTPEQAPKAKQIETKPAKSEIQPNIQTKLQTKTQQSTIQQPKLETQKPKTQSEINPEKTLEKQPTDQPDKQLAKPINDVFSDSSMSQDIQKKLPKLNTDNQPDKQNQLINALDSQSTLGMNKSEDTAKTDAKTTAKQTLAQLHAFKKETQVLDTVDINPPLQNNQSQDNPNQLEQKAVIEPIKETHQQDLVNQTDKTEHQITKPAPINNQENTEVIDNPLDLLKCPIVHLSGSWTLDKWEFWLRNADLIPAEINLAHKSIAEGDIGKHTLLKIPIGLEKLTPDFFPRIAEKLIKKWPDMLVDFEIVDEEMQTPEQLAHLRQEKANDAAMQKMMSENIVHQLQQTFQATINQVALHH